ncbi:MAG TPA: hypothetical protein VE977_06515 [Pyrinomonadaceae bacterium]|nr:hypothetical protein [Pyrinomonadaceae bacterium]
MLQAINAGSDCFAKAASSIRSLPLAVLQCQSYQNEKARRALPFAAGFPLVAYLRYYRGDRSLFHQIDVGSPPALSPSLAGSQRIGDREAADPLTSDKLQFVDDAESTKSGSLSARRFFISSRRSFNRRNFKRLNFARVAFAARNCSFKFVNVPISALLNGAAAAKNHPAMTRPGSSLATTVPPPVVG